MCCFAAEARLQVRLWLLSSFFSPPPLSGHHVINYHHLFVCPITENINFRTLEITDRRIISPFTITTMSQYLLSIRGIFLFSWWGDKDVGMVRYAQFEL